MTAAVHLLTGFLGYPLISPKGASLLQQLHVLLAGIMMGQGATREGAWVLVQVQAGKLIGIGGLIR